MSDNQSPQKNEAKLFIDIPNNEKNNVVVPMNKKYDDSPIIRQPNHYYFDEEIEGIEEKVEKRESFISNILSDDDFKQKMSMCVTVTIEMYRVIMSSLLLLFVPQSCNNNQCTINEKLSPELPYEMFVLISNFFILFAFTITYMVESRRENILITYLDINRFKPRDNDSVAKELLKLSNTRLQRIEKYDKFYKHLSYSSICVFILNTLFSLIVIFDNFLDSKTITVLLTNMLFMSSKLYDMYTIVNTKDFVFLSAYLSRKIQFNDVDKDKIEQSPSNVDSDSETPVMYSNYSAPPLAENE